MCTGIRLTAENKAIVYARTMEFAKDMESDIIIIPRNYAFASATNEDFKWKATYAAVGANALGELELLDGVNEKGLGGGLFYFPDYAEYQKATPDQLSSSLAPWQLMTWILTSFATVAEVKKALPKIRVVGMVFGKWGIIPPIHAIVHDATGASLVIEYIKGELHLHDNPLGVFTNAPSFDWHLTNINNYNNLSPYNAEQRTIDGLKSKPLGQGSGLLGLPGDFTSPSRFIRATALSQSVIGMKAEQEARDVAFHILDAFTIPRGAVREKDNTGIYYEYTQWTVASDLKNKHYYFHTYDNREVKMVDLMKANLDTQKPVIISMQSPEIISDITP